MAGHRRRRWFALDNELMFDRFMAQLENEFGLAGVAAWVLLLAAVSRSPDKIFVYRGEELAWHDLGVETRPDFTFEAFLEFTGRYKKTRRTTRTRRTDVEITRWTQWQHVRKRPAQEGKVSAGYGPDTGLLHSTGLHSTDTKESSLRSDSKVSGPKTVNRTPVTEAELTFASQVLATWNERTGQSLKANGHLGKIIMRHREYPEVTLEQHAAVIDRNLADPWWKGAATPNVIYGSDDQFESAMQVTGAARRKETAVERYQREKEAERRERQRGDGGPELSQLGLPYPVA